MIFMKFLTCITMLLSLMGIAAAFYFFKVKKIRKYDHLVFKDSSFDFQLMRTMGYSICQMADTNECLVTAHRIKEGDVESWYNQWHTLAERTHNIAEQCMKDGHQVSAYSAFLRACNYYRASDFYLHGTQADPRIRNAGRKSRACFAQALTLTQHSISHVQIPYENIMLPGYLYRVDDKQRPTLIVQTGFDGTQEELYVYALEGLKRGYHVLTFEGPGQGSVLREQGLPFRADWEVVTRAVVDFAVSQPEIDPQMLILYGLSLGGYLAPRGASGDDRIKILIANSGIYDLLEGIANAHSRFGLSKNEMLEKARNHSSIFNNIIRMMMKLKIELRWSFEHGMFAFQAKTPSELIRKYAECTLQDRAQFIKCTTLICESEHEFSVMQGQAQRLYDQLTCPKTFMNFTQAEGAGLHCQLGALLLSNQRIFDWLDTIVASLKK